MMRTRVGGGMGAIAAVTIGRRRLEPHKGSWILDYYRHLELSGRALTSLFGVHTTGVPV
jgi:hypothetical protein